MIPEVAEYSGAYKGMRAKILETLAAVPESAWAWTPTADETNSLLVLATHAIGSEHGWIHEILGRGEKTRNRPAEFQTRQGSMEQLRAKYAQVAAETDALLEKLTRESLSTMRESGNYGVVSERWILMHVVEHYAEHLGQMYLTKQLWETKHA